MSNLLHRSLKYTDNELFEHLVHNIRDFVPVLITIIVANGPRILTSLTNSMQQVVTALSVAVLTTIFFQVETPNPLMITIGGKQVLGLQIPDPSAFHFMYLVLMWIALIMVVNGLMLNKVKLNRIKKF